MAKIPVETQRELEALISEKLPVDQIAFMMRLDPEVVRQEIERSEQAKKRPA